MGVKVRRSKIKTVLRCAFCHAGDGKMQKCSACGTRVHQECFEENDGCPTMGCGEQQAYVVPTPAPGTWLFPAGTFQNYPAYAAPPTWTATTQSYYTTSHLDGVLVRPLPPAQEAVEESFSESPPRDAFVSREPF